MRHGWKVYTYTIDTGAGAQTITQNLDPIDLSRCEWLDIVVTLTKADTDADDTLDCYLEETTDGTFWDKRWHSHQFLGTLSPSSSAPEIYRYRISANTAIDTSDEAYEVTGSAGASDLPAASVRNGPFRPKYRTSAGWQAAYRLRLVVADPTGSNADFEGNIQIWGTSPC